MPRPTLLLLLSLSNAAAWLIASSPRALPLSSQRQRAASLRMAEDDEGFTFGAVDTADDGYFEEERELTEKEKEIARLRAAEKFMMRDTGNAQCRVCTYKFMMSTGDRGAPKNTPFELLPDSYVCPQCKSPKAFFDPEQIEIAGFADNQQYGFGTNTWTEAQKSNFIFGGLGLFVLLFLGGYALN